MDDKYSNRGKKKIKEILEGENKLTDSFLKASKRHTDRLIDMKEEIEEVRAKNENLPKKETYYMVVFRYDAGSDWGIYGIPYKNKQECINYAKGYIGDKDVEIKVISFELPL